MTRRSLVLIAVLIAVLTVSGGLLWWGLGRAPLVPAVRVAAAPLLRTLQFSARVVTPARVDIGSTLTGRVQTVAVAAGAQVAAGEVLVRLERDELSAALDQALANERQAAARLAGLRSTGRSAAQAAVAQTESVLVAAAADLQRTRDLVAKGFLSEARLDEAQRAVAVATAQLAGARAQSAANGEQGTDLAQAQAQLAVARSAVVAAQARLAQTVLSAPADARVLVRAVEPGQIVQPGRALLSLALSGPVQLVGQVDERFLEQLQVGQTASVLADAFAAQRFAARVLLIAPLVDAQRGAIEVTLAVDQPPAFLREDMTLSIELETARRERTLFVPAAALVDANVRIVRDGRVEVRAVRLGLRTLEAVEVLEGLVDGDVVLLGKAPAPGQRVRADVLAATAALQSAKPAGEDAGTAMSNAMAR